MREIKFRGKEEEGDWLYGDLRQRMGYWPAIIESYCTDDGKVGYREVAVDEKTVGQYTGLKDKNGKEIYEGDILTNECGSILHVVAYSEEEASFVGIIPSLKEKSGKPFTTGLNLPWLTNKEKKVIGNIHDNPELLKED